MNGCGQPPGITPLKVGQVRWVSREESKDGLASSCDADAAYCGFTDRHAPHNPRTMYMYCIELCAVCVVLFFQMVGFIN